MHTFSALRFCARAVHQLLELTDEERAALLPAAGAHRGARGRWKLPALVLGSRIFFTEGIDTFLADLQRARPTIFLSVPRLLLKFQQGVFAKIPKRKTRQAAAHPDPQRYFRKTRPAPARAGYGAPCRLRGGAAAARTSALVPQARARPGGRLRHDGDLDHASSATGTVRPGYVGAAIRGRRSASSARTANCWSRAR